MAAGINDKFKETFNSANPNVTFVSTQRSAAATTLICDSLAGWPTNTAVDFITYQLDTDGETVVPGSQRDWKGIVSSNTITNLTLIAGGADAGNQVNDIVEMTPTANWAQDLVEGILVSHDQDGSLKDGIVTTSKIDDEAVTTAKIDDGAVTADKIDFTTFPRFRAARTTAMNTSTSFTDVVFNSESYDIGSNYNTSDGKFTAPVTGYYHFDGALHTSAGTTRLIVSLYVDGTEVCRGSRVDGVSASGTSLGSIVSCDVYMTAGQSATIRNNAASVVAVDASSASTYFNGHLVALG